MEKQATWLAGLIAYKYVGCITYHPGTSWARPLSSILGWGSYKAIMWWLLLSPDYLLFLGLTWVYTFDYMSWQGMAKLGQYAWTIDAMLLVGVVYFILNSVLYGKSTRLYKVVSALVILACSLYIMLVPVTDFIEGIGPRPANNLSITPDGLHRYRRSYRRSHLVHAPVHHG